MTSSNTSTRQIARAAGTVMIAFVLSNLVGLLRQVLVSRAFGTSASMDAFNTAVIIPDVLFNLMAGGALASAFLPTFTDFIARQDRAGAWKLASAVMLISASALGFASGLTALFAPLLVRQVLFSLNPALDPAIETLTVDLLRIVLLAPMIFGVSGLLMSILNTHQKFWLPALAPVFNWLGWIIGLVFLTPSLGIYGLAWGYVLGALMHLSIQLPGLWSVFQADRAEMVVSRWSVWRELQTPVVWRVFGLMAPRLLGVAAVQMNFVINAMLAAGQVEGSLTAINVARMVMTMPLFVIAQAIATAALPTFAAQVARKELADMRSALASTLRAVIWLSLPATLGIILLRGPIVSMLFEGGEFDARSSEMVSWALLWYTAGLVGHAVVEILSRAFYALQDTKTPVGVGVFVMILNAILSFVFAGMFSSLGWMPHGGLALANSLSTALEAVWLYGLMSKRLSGVEGARILTGIAQFSFAGLWMAAGLIGWLRFSVLWPAWLQAMGGVALGGVIYAILTTILRVQEMDMLVGVLRRRLGRFTAPGE